MDMKNETTDEPKINQTIFCISSAQYVCSFFFNKKNCIQNRHIKDLCMGTEREKNVCKRRMKSDFRLNEIESQLKVKFIALVAPHSFSLSLSLPFFFLIRYLYFGCQKNIQRKLEHFISFVEHIFRRAFTKSLDLDL